MAPAMGMPASPEQEGVDRVTAHGLMSTTGVTRLRSAQPPSVRGARRPFVLSAAGEVPSKPGQLHPVVEGLRGSFANLWPSDFSQLPQVR